MIAVSVYAEKVLVVAYFFVKAVHNSNYITK